MNQKTKEIHLRISEEEYHMLLMQRDFLKYSSISQVLRAYIHSGHCYRFDMSGFYDFSTQISRVGNNINQIAAVVNETYSVTPYQMKMLQKQMSEVQEIVKTAAKENMKIIKFKENENWAGDINGDYKNHKSKGQPKCRN